MMKGDAVPVENRKEQDPRQHVLVQLSNNLFSVCYVQHISSMINCYKITLVAQTQIYRH